MLSKFQCLCIIASSKIFTKWAKDYNYPQFQFGKSLLGIVTDWSDVEVNGLKEFAGDAAATQLLKRMQKLLDLFMTLCS